MRSKPPTCFSGWNNPFTSSTNRTSHWKFTTNQYIPYMDVSENNATPKSSILIGFSIINHPFWGTPIFGNTPKEKGYFGLIPKQQITSHPTGHLENHWKSQGTYPSSGECLYPKLERLSLGNPVKCHPGVWNLLKTTQGKVMNTIPTYQ